LSDWPTTWTSRFGPMTLNDAQVPLMYRVLARHGGLNLFWMARFGNWLDRAGFTEFFFQTHEEAGDWCRTGVREVQ
jgi:hypothetical protein